MKKDIIIQYAANDINTIKVGDTIKVGGKEKTATEEDDCKKGGSAPQPIFG